MPKAQAIWMMVLRDLQEARCDIIATRSAKLHLVKIEHFSSRDTLTAETVVFDWL